MQVSGVRVSQAESVPWYASCFLSLSSYGQLYQTLRCCQDKADPVLSPSVCTCYFTDLEYSPSPISLSDLFLCTISLHF